MANNNYIDIMEKNHMEIPWHDYTSQDSDVLISKAGLIEKASVSIIPETGTKSKSYFAFYSRKLSQHKSSSGTYRPPSAAPQKVKKTSCRTIPQLAI